MLAIQIELLTGRYVATWFNDRARTEWPPHPARLAYALVAAWADSDEPDPEERRALTWLESLGDPSIVASDAAVRDPVTYYVPNNDHAVARDLTPLYRRLSDAATQLADAAAQMGDPPSPATQQGIAKLGREVEKLRVKAVADSAKATASKAAETAATVRAGLAILPEGRGRQARHLPTVIPVDPTVQFIWPDAQPTDDQRATLQGLLERVSRLGHSSSMVACSLVDEPLAPTLQPEPGGGQQLRVMAPGMLDELEASYALHQGVEPRSLPARITSYAHVGGRPPGREPRPAMGEDWVVLALPPGRSLPLTDALAVAMATRGAIMRHADQPLPEVISGHLPGPPGELTPASTQPHLAVVPLAFVGSEHADGGIRGVALVLPREVTADERIAVRRAVGAWERAGRAAGLKLALASSRVLRLQVQDVLSAPVSLRPWRWCRAATEWASVTPIALDRHAGRLWSPIPEQRRSAEERAIESVRGACRNIGLPTPEVTILRAGAITGVPASNRFPVYRSPGRQVRRQCTHVHLRFPEAVRGPVLLGAGRYLGYGLCQPLLPGELAEDVLGAAP